MQQQGVRKRHGRVLDALARCGRCGQGRQRGIHRHRQAGLDLPLAHARSQVAPHVQHERAGGVEAAAGLFKLGCGQPALQHRVIALVAQLQPQRMHKCNRTVHHAYAHVIVAPRRVQRHRQVNQALALARQRAGAVHDLAPQLARFPVAVVGGGVAKPQKNRQRQANQGERDGGERDLEREQVAVHHGDQRCQQDIEQQGEADTLQHRAAQHQKQPQPGGTLTNNHAEKPRVNAYLTTTNLPATKAARPA